MNHIRIVACVATLLLRAEGALAQSTEWLLAPSTAGKVVNGMTIENLYSAYGRNNVRLVDLFGEGKFEPALQIYMPFEPGAAIAVAHYGQICGQYRVTGVSVYSARFRTTEGVGVGSTVAEVRRHYPMAKANRENAPSLIVEKLTMTFMLSSGRFSDTSRVVTVWNWGRMSDSLTKGCR